jgi:hypothetical protein
VRLVWATVEAIEREVPGAQFLLVRFDEGTGGRAVSYPPLAGTCSVGECVLLNTTAVDLELGTGGTHFVVARGRGTSDVVLDEPSGGHIMKMRYAPLQLDVLSVEEQGSAAHDVMQRATTLAGMPVACCGLHSQVPLVAAAVKDAEPALRVAYVMTDFAALPLALSDLVRSAAGAGLLDATITCGQSFGGELEAVNLHSGLLAARHVAAADVAIVAIGPGVVGTATPFGHGGVAQGEAVNAAAVLGGRPVATLRVSFADARERHRGVSHHTLTALTSIALASAVVPVPDLPAKQLSVVAEQLEGAGVWARHERFDARRGAPDLRGVRVTTMGRGERDDPAFFQAAFAAGEACAVLKRDA